MATLWVDLFDRSISLNYGHNHIWVLCKLYKVVFCQKCNLNPKPRGCETQKASLKSCTTKKRAVCQWTCEMYHRDKVKMSPQAMATCRQGGGIVRHMMEGRQACCYRRCNTPPDWKGVPAGHQWCTPHLQTL